MGDIAFLTVQQVKTIHRRVIEKFGGDGGLRDGGLLESAVAMPQSSFAGDFLHRGIEAMAAAYYYHLCANHPFVDGNKRVAVAAAEVFLSLNGYALDASDEQIEELTLGVAEGNTDKDAVIQFFARHTRESRDTMVR